jgi:hypothetical protein
MIAAMQKLDIRRLWILIIFLPGFSNALRANCDYQGGKARAKIGAFGNNRQHIVHGTGEAFI